MDELWGLIQDEASAVKGYYKALDKYKDIPEVVEVLTDIIADERDHLNALNYVYEELVNVKPATDAITLAKKAFSKAKAAKIYKESLAKEG